MAKKKTKMEIMAERDAAFDAVEKLTEKLKNYKYDYRDLETAFDQNSAQWQDKCEAATDRAQRAEKALVAAVLLLERESDYSTGLREMVEPVQRPPVRPVRLEPEPEKSIQLPTLAYNLPKDWAYLTMKDLDLNCLIRPGCNRDQVRDLIAKCVIRGLRAAGIEVVG